MAKLTKEQLRNLPKVTISAILHDVEMQLISDPNDPNTTQLVEPDVEVVDNKIDSVVRMRGRLPGTDKYPDGQAITFSVNKRSYHKIPSEYYIDSDGLWSIKGCKVIPKGSEVLFDGETSPKPLQESMVWGGLAKYKGTFE